MSSLVTAYRWTSRYGSMMVVWYGAAYSVDHNWTQPRHGVIINTATTAAGHGARPTEQNRPLLKVASTVTRYLRRHPGGTFDCLGRITGSLGALIVARQHGKGTGSPVGERRHGYGHLTPRVTIAHSHNHALTHLHHVKGTIAGGFTMPGQSCP